jgi:PST family polysaccharide transporter
VAFPVAAFFGEPAVRWVIIALSFTFLTTGLRVLPRALLTRDLQFKRISAIDASEALISVALTLVLAALGFRYWSLVWGGVTGSIVATVLALRWRPHRRHWPRDFALVTPSLRFGWHLVVARFAWYFYSSADFAVVGKLFGKAALGGYGFAWTLASIPVTRISALVSQVTPAIFSAVQNDRAQLSRYFLRLTEGLAFITFPFSIGVALVAEEFVLVALGEEWRPAIVPLQLLAFYAGLRSITTLHAQVLQAVGRSRDQMRFSLLALAVLPPMFYLGGKLFGISGVAWAWIVGYPLVMIPPYRAVFRATGVTLIQYLSCLWPAMLGSAAMAAGVLLVGALLPPELSHLPALLIESATGAVIYAIVMFGLQRKRVLVLKDLLLQLRK